jgi:signal transduction histidine kinase
MIRWILDRKWLSISLYAAVLFCISGGIELLNQNFFGLVFSFTIAVALFASRKFTWVALPLIPISSYLMVWGSNNVELSVAVIAIVVFAVALFGNRVQRTFLVSASVLASLVLGFTLGYLKADTEFLRAKGLIQVVGFVGLSFALAQALGRLTFIRVEHIGSPLDKAQASITSGRLRLEIAKQNERLEIAKDLSELLVQRISAVVSVTEGGRYAVSSDPSAATRILERSHEAGRAAQAELRRLYDYLNSAIISDVASFKISDLTDLAVAYRELGYNTVISQQGESFALNEGMELCVYKIVFEALKNVRKHAPIGTEIGVDFLWVEDGLQILIKDNGIEVTNRQKAGLGELVEGYGVEDDLESLVSEFDGATLAALRDRAAIYKGRIEANKVAGVGFTLSAIFPNLKSLAIQED